MTQAEPARAAAGRAAPPAAGGSRAQRRAGRRKVEVLEAAGRVIADRGADAARFTDVAAESGVPVSSLQYLFGSREDLLVAAFQHASGTETGSLEDSLAGLTDPWDRLTYIVARALAGYQEDRAKAGRLWIESWHFGIRDEEMRASALRDYAEWRRLVADAVRLGTRSGRFTSTFSPERLAMLTIAMVDGLGIPLALGDPETSVDAATQDVLTALTDLLQPSGDQR
jgi:AcrR family transcriptional regulator